MTKEQLDKILIDHAEYLINGYFSKKANLCGADLRGANLYGANLRVADLCGANLYGADLRGADLRGANLRGADLCGANLYGADLCGADLRGADLRGADLRGANLYGADLRGADLRGADLRRADLRGAKNGNKELIKCNSILGLKWDILIFNDMVTVGCQKHAYKEWLSFTEEKIKEMHRDALDFYPLLISILKYEYKGTIFEGKNE